MDSFYVSVTKKPIFLEEQIKVLDKKNISSHYGALSSFSGIARASNRLGKVDELYVEHYEEMTKKSMLEIVKQTQEKYQIDYTHLVHRYGFIKPGSIILFVACLSKHRRGGFAAISDIVDALKNSVPLWKKETGDFGELWVESENKKFQ